MCACVCVLIQSLHLFVHHHGNQGTCHNVIGCFCLVTFVFVCFTFPESSISVLSTRLHVCVCVYVCVCVRVSVCLCVCLGGQMRHFHPIPSVIIVPTWPRLLSRSRRLIAASHEDPSMSDLRALMSPNLKPFFFSGEEDGGGLSTSSSSL